MEPREERISAPDGSGLSPRSVNLNQVSSGLFHETGAKYVESFLESRSLLEFLGLYGLNLPDYLDWPAETHIPHAPGFYADAAMELLLEYVRPKVEMETGLELSPTYAYFRRYESGAVLEKHRDRPACEVSVSLTLSSTPEEEHWTLVALDPESQTEYLADLAEGDALIYRGAMPHWRTGPYRGRCLVQVFLHYVCRNIEHEDDAVFCPEKGRFLKRREF